MASYRLRSSSQGHPLQSEAEDATRRVRLAKSKLKDAQAVEAAQRSSKKRSLPGPKSAEELALRIGALATTLTVDERKHATEELGEQYKAYVEAELVRKLERRPVDEPEEEEEDATTFLALKDYIDERLSSTGKGTSVIDQLLRLTGLDVVPLPLDFTNTQISLDPRWWVAVWNEVELSWDDVQAKFRKRSDGGRLRREYLTALSDSLRLEDTVMGVAAMDAVERLVNLHVALACHWLSTESTLSATEFLLRWDSLVVTAEKDCEIVFKDFAERCGASTMDFKIGHHLRKARVPSFLQAGVEMSLKGAYFRGRAGPPKKDGLGKKVSPGSNLQIKAKYDPDSHVVVRDNKGVEWFHSKRSDGKAGRRLGRK
jgi:hypothetical protein